MEKPVFDLILGTNTMNELGIVLNFKQNTITIDEIELPMTSITNMPASKIRKALTLNNNQSGLHHPLSNQRKIKHRKPFPLPKTVLSCKSWKASLLQQPQLSIWAITPSDWILMYPESVPSFSLRTSTPTKGYRWVQQVHQTSFKQKCRNSWPPQSLCKLI